MLDASTAGSLLGLILAGSLGLALGALAGRALWDRERRAMAAELQQTRSDLTAANTRLETTSIAREELREAFKSLASDALTASQAQFLELAGARLETAEQQHVGELEKRKAAIDELVKPLAQSLVDLRNFTVELEGQRKQAYGEVRQQLEQLSGATQELGSRSMALATALQGSSQSRGRWGEIALRNIAELAGMTEHCDFIEQAQTADGQRPDMVVRLPGGGVIPIDAKVPLADYLEACASSDPGERENHLIKHAGAMRTAARELARRDYASSLGGRVDYTVMFVPGEPILAAAFEKNPELQVEAVRSRILIVTPITLIALLRTVAVYWRQEQVAENAEQVWKAALELYSRIAGFQEKLSRVGKGLGTALDVYNEAVGSFVSRVLPAGRRLEGLGAVSDAAKKLEEPAAVEKPVRELPSG